MTNRPANDDLTDIAEEPATPSQSGGSGGTLAQEIGARDEAKTALGGDPTITRVHKGDKADGGDEPNLPNRAGGGTDDSPDPKRS